MAVQDYGFVPLGQGIGNALMGVATLKQRDRALAADEQQNALLQQRLQVGQDEQTRLREQEQTKALANMIYEGVRAKEPRAIEASIQILNRVAPMDPQAAASFRQNPERLAPALERVFGIQPQQEPAQLSSERVGGFEVLRDQTGKVYGQGRVKEGPSVVVAGGGQAPDGKPPQGYRWTADGNLEVIPGGPADAKTTQPLSPKDTNTARVKLTQVQIARNQLNTAKQRFEALRNSFSAGPGGNLLPTPAGKAFDAAIDSMRGSITALTRVPGVGAMSDYETRLDQAKFPTRGKYEDVAAQQLQALEDLLNTIEGGYAEMLGTKQPNTDAAPEPKVQRKEAPQSAVEHLRKNPQLKAAFFEKYGYLPDGL